MSQHVWECANKEVMPIDLSLDGPCAHLDTTANLSLEKGEALVKRRTLVSVLILLLVGLVALSPPMAAQGPNAPEPARVQDNPSVSQGMWHYGPPSDFEYQRFDGAFVPGPYGEPWANKVYFMGGRISAPSELPNIWMFDPVTGTYADTGDDMIEDVSNYNSDLILNDGTGRGPAIYVVGGYDKDGGSGGGGLGLVQRYYPQFNLIESLPPVDDWPGQVGGNTVAGQGTAVVNDIIYVFGGWDSSTPPYFYTGTWAFDPTQPTGSRWTDLGIPFNPGRTYIMTAVQGEKIYAIGGIYQYIGGDLVPTDVVQVLDTNNLAAGWTNLSPMPFPLAEGRAFGFDVDTLGTDAPWHGFLYTAGGGDWPDITREAMEYNIGTDTWDQAFPDLNDRRVNNAGSFIPLCTLDPNDGLPGMWVFGGRSENGCDPPYGATEFYGLPCVCIGLTDATILGPTEVLVGELITYSVALEPLTPTLPITIEWSNGLTGTSAVYSWDEPGLYTVVATATNCGGAITADPLEVTVSCAELTTATISGPDIVLPGEVTPYTVTWEPDDATPPIDIEWSNGLTDTQAVYSWDDPGLYTIVVTATNCYGSAVVTDTFDVEVMCVALTGATISGPEELMVGEMGIYSVTLEPPTATAPIDLLWSDGTTGFTATFSWTEPGTHTVEVTATNCVDVQVVGGLDVAVIQPMHRIYLPIVVRSN
jgi:hypothetical protein